MKLRQRGSTLVELFLALTLLAALLGMAVIHFDTILGALDRKPTEDVLRQVVRDAHMQARSSGAPVFLGYSEEDTAVVLYDARGETLQRVLLGDAEAARRYSLTFFRVLPEERLDGAVAREIEDRSIPYVLFHPSGASVPVELHLSTPHDTQVLRLDPFSSAPWELE